jgi:hypothetical protein
LNHLITSVAAPFSFPFGSTPRFKFPFDVPERTALLAARREHECNPQYYHFYYFIACLAHRVGVCSES